MVTVEAAQSGDGNAQPPKYFVDIEGTEYPWDRSTITVPEIRSLSGIPADVPILEIDADNNQRQLAENEVVELKPGHGFSKKIKFKRGGN